MTDSAKPSPATATRPEAKAQTDARARAVRSRQRIAVWALRLLVGAVFIVSGLAKTIDIWGFIYKIEDYLTVWQWTVPRSLVLMGATLLAGSEFVGGLMLLTGCYRRMSVRFLSLIMAGMLPLSLYIYIANPVSDCGCFGDMIVLSNPATFWKNVAICLALIPLWAWNTRFRGLFTIHVQWLIMTIPIAYVIVVANYGYFIQPMVDFRSFPEGSMLIKDDEAEESDPELEPEFVYSRNGETRTFTIDNLPDSTWEYVDRIDKVSPEDFDTELAFYDLEGNEVSEDVISPSGKMMILIVPQLSRTDVSATYFLNELNSFMTRQGGEMIALIAGTESDVDYWKDMSMADYPIYTAESTMLKEMARGNMALIYVDNGRIVWKRNLASFDTDPTISIKNVDTPASAGSTMSLSLMDVSMAALLLLIAVYLLDSTGRLVNWGIKRRKKSK